jgi:hypothetical protein
MLISMYGTKIDISTITHPISIFDIEIDEETQVDEESFHSNVPLIHEKRYHLFDFFVKCIPPEIKQLVVDYL